MRHAVALILLAAGLCGCSEDTPQALGTLEYDRITLPAPAAERNRLPSSGWRACCR